MKIERDLYINLMNMTYAIIIAGFIIILITTGSTNQNSLSALIGGYSTVLVALLFFGTIIWINMNSEVMYPMFKLLAIFLNICGIIILLIVYLSIYFERIISDKVSNYYYSFSNLSTIFLAVQIMMLFSIFFNKKEGDMGRSLDKTFSIILLLGLVNIIIVTTIGIVLKYYSTQG
jgi:hypothetical protein